jgi:hypothetical protein
VVKTMTAALCLTLAVSTMSACVSQPAAETNADVARAGAASAAIAPAAAHAQAAGAPAGSSAPQAMQTVTGTVLETMDAATYTYVRVKTASGEVWAAASTFKVAVGDRVVVPLEMPMENFHSNALKRDFPVIYFASGITKEGEAPASAMGMGGAMGGALPPGHNPTGAARAVVTEVIPQPAGGTTVAALWTNRKALAGKSVTVRGKVVKYNGGILGRNWLHLQDGTGTEKDGTNDITVTSASAAKVGDIVTITGTLVLDKDFTAGYAYAVLIEDATIK